MGLRSFGFSDDSLRPAGAPRPWYDHNDGAKLSHPSRSYQNVADAARRTSS